MTVHNPSLSGAIALSGRVEFPAAALVERPALTAAVAVAKAALERNQVVPILTNVRLHAEGGAVVVTGTDCDMEIRVAVAAGAVDKEFATTLPCDKLEAFLKKAAACDLVAFSTVPGPVGTDKDGTPYSEAGTCSVEFDKVKYRLNSLPVADFPVLEFGEARNGFTLPGKALWDMVDGTMGAISTEETRYYLNGIFCHVVNRGNFHAFTMVATDGHRLYRQEVEAPNGALDMAGAILPRKLVEVFHKLTKGKACPDAVRVEFDGVKVRMAWANVVVTSKLIDGSFPDYQRVIPSGDGHAATFDRDGMAEAVKSVMLVLSGKSRSVRFAFTAGSVRLSANDPETGNAESDLPCSWQGDDFEIGINGAYLQEALVDVGAGNVTMTFGVREIESRKVSDPGAPLRMSGTRADWDAVLMPLRA